MNNSSLIAPAVFVMGATGRVGGEVVRALAGQRAVVAATQSDRPPNGAYRWVRFGLETTDTHAAALDGVDCVFLMRPPQVTAAKAFVPFLSEVKARGIRRIVFLSVLGADSNRLLPHNGIEELVKQMDFEWTMVRPSDFMQNLETVHLESIRDRDEIAVPAGQGRSSFVDVKDVGEVIAKAILDGAHAMKGYTVTGSVALSFVEVAAILSAVLERTISYRRLGIPAFVAEQTLRQGKPVPLTLVMSALYTVQRLGRASAVTSEILQLLDRRPGTMAEYVTRNRRLWSR